MALPATSTLNVPVGTTLSAWSASWTAAATNFVGAGFDDACQPDLSNAFCAAFWNADVFNDAQYSQCPMSVNSFNGGPAVRMSGSGVSGVQCYFLQVTSTEVIVAKRSGGATTTLGAAITKPASGTTIRLEVSTVGGNAELRVYWASTLQATRTDSSSPILSGSAGIAGNSASDNEVQFRTWEGGNLVSAADLAGAAQGAATAAGRLLEVHALLAAAQASGVAIAQFDRGLSDLFIVGDLDDYSLFGGDAAIGGESFFPPGAGNQALEGAAQAAGNATGALSVAKALAATATGAGTATAALAVGKGLAGSAAGGADAAASIAVAKPLAGAGTGGATASGLLAIVKALAGAAAASGQAAADLASAGTVTLQGAALAQGSASGDLGKGVPLTAAAVAASVVAGALGVGKGLGASATGSGAGSGALLLGIGLQAAAVGRGSAAADLQGSAGLSGAAVAGGQGSGVLTLTVRLNGAAIAAGLASGALASQIAALAGNAQGQAAAVGALQLQIPLSGAAIAQAQAQGGLALVVRLSASALAQGIATGSLSVNGDAIALVGAAVAQAQAAGALGVAGLAGSTPGVTVLLQALAVRIGPLRFGPRQQRIGAATLRRRY